MAVDVKRFAALLLLGAVVAAGVWWWRRPPAPAQTTLAPVAPSGSPLGLRIVVMTGAPGSSAAITARIFNQEARQAALDRAAAITPSSGTPPRVAAAVKIETGHWEEWLTVEQVTPGRAGTPLPGIRLRKSPSGPVTLDDSTTLTLVFECAAADLPAPGTRLMATYRSPNGLVRSNVATLPDAPTAGVPALLADARVARVLGDVGRMDAAASALVREAPELPDGPYYAGLALDARGDRDKALVAYRLALSKLAAFPSGEPAAELRFLIRQLEAKGRRP